MKIGVLGCAYDCDLVIDEVMKGWIEAFSQSTNHQFVMSVVHAQFKEYADMFGAKPTIVPSWREKYREIISYFFTPAPCSEAEARDLALRPLLQEGCDLIILLDMSDEYFSCNQITSIIQFIEKNPLVPIFKFSLKNYVFDNKHYLKQPFTPQRAFRVTLDCLRLHSVSYDNNVGYQNCKTGQIIPDSLLSSLTIPKAIAWISHLSWVDSPKTRSKIDYQTLRWGQDGCGYWVDPKTNKLDFNPKFYANNGLPIPEVCQD